MINVLDYNQAALADWFAAQQQPRYRAQQLLAWIHQKGVVDFALMTNLSRTLRDFLQQHALVALPEQAHEQLSHDGTIKWLFRLHDGNHIETVFIPEADRGTLCVSSQVGCALNCRFCATGDQGFNRNLTLSEVIGQLWLARLRLQQLQRGQDITNVVFMGMGEPLLNTDVVVDALHLMLSDTGYGLSKYKVTVSTSGVVPNMQRLASQVDCALAVSLHAPTDSLRNILVPINKKYPIAILMEACRKHFAVGKRHVVFEYVLLAGVNDSLLCARQLTKLLSGMAAKVNLIPFNPYPGARYQRSSEKDITAFSAILHRSGIRVTVRRTRGDDIKAACGQLQGDFVDRTRRRAQRAQERVEG